MQLSGEAGNFSTRNSRFLICMRTEISLSLEESTLSRATKIILYKTLIRPVVLCGAEAWTLTKKERKALLIFERKVFRIIYGPKYEDGKWKSRTNLELEEISKGKNIVKL